MKRYYDVNCGERGNGYAAEERRGGVKTDFSFAEKIVVPKVYNAAGQIIPKTKAGSRDKKRDDIGSSASKDVAKRLASPNETKK
ncbi:unnamed protein product [Sphagnum balticum]